MAHTDYVITAPIGMNDVQAVLKTTANTLSALCAHENVNPWSRYKPVCNASPSLRLTAGNAYRNGGACGFEVIRYNSLSDLMTSGSLVRQPWTYAPPGHYKLSVGGGYPYRLGDFDRYCHNAPAPVSGFAAPPYITKSNAQMFTARLIDGFKLNNSGTQIDPDITVDYTQPGSLTLGEITLDGVCVADMYFGVAVFTMAEGTTLPGAMIWARTDTKPGTFSLMKSFDTSRTIANGSKVYMVPFWSRFSIQNDAAQGAAGPFYIPPECAPAVVTVGASQQASGITLHTVTGSARRPNNLSGADPGTALAYIRATLRVEVSGVMNFTGCTLQLLQGATYAAVTVLDTISLGVINASPNSPYTRTLNVGSGQNLATGNNYWLAFRLNNGGYTATSLVLMPSDA